jgi:hypothetical protein|tara:strand:- start:62 stop:439 length:378 start_codon:yes stop_codon:yes gene_type:complete
MALIDDVFGSIPADILADWGQDITYVKAGLPSVYNPTTGTVNNFETTVTVKAVITNVNPSEYEGLYQTTDLKVIFGAAELGDYYPEQADRIRYTQAGETREAKLIDINTKRGAEPVLHTVIARPQ